MNIFLREEETHSLLFLASKITACPSNQPELFIKEVKHAIQFIPWRLYSILRYFADSDMGYIVIRKLPTVDKPSTPPDNTHHLGEKTIAAKIQAMLNQVIGEMISYQAEGYGKMFQDMVPNYALSNTQTSLSSAVELEIHTEQAFSPLKPDYLSLCCLMGNPEAKTYVFHKQTLLKNLPEEKIQMLYSPLWKIGVDMSFKMNGLKGDIRGPIPILDSETGDFVFDQDLMFGINKDAESLKREIIEIYHSKKTELILHEGDLVILNNRRVVHGRSSFKPKYDGSDRFIIRTFAMNEDNYKSCIHARRKEERTIETIYS